MPRLWGETFLFGAANQSESLQLCSQLTRGFAGTARSVPGARRARVGVQALSSVSSLLANCILRYRRVKLLTAIEPGLD